MIYSAAYYPELWNEAAITQDIEYMKKAGLNAVRIAEFAWSNMEPEEGRIDLAFFRGIIERLYENGISTILCTPTPTPPIWMTHGHPERLFVNRKGEALVHGSRQHVCTNHPHMRRCSDRIVEAMAKELGSLPGVIAWQLDNEFKCHVHECFCETCRGQWHLWLEEKYGTIEALNDAWGTKIWSEEYRAFNQIPIPSATPFIHNSSLEINYREFSHDKIAEFAKSQIDIIRKYSTAPITHNACPGFGFDHETMFAPMDFASFDMYPNSAQYDQAHAFYDLYRGLGQDGMFWLMETSTSHNGCLLGSQHTHPNSYLEAELFAAAAAGARAISYWLWRQQKSGCEQLHGSLLSSWGTPTIGFEPARRLGEKLFAMEEILDKSTVVPSKFGISYSDVARRFFEVEPIRNIDYLAAMTKVHHRMSSVVQPVDCIWPQGSFDGCEVVLTPFLPDVPDALIEKGRSFMENGGTWIVGPMAGYRTKELTVPTDCGLHHLEKAFGFTTKFVYPIYESGAKIEGLGTSGVADLYAAVFADEPQVKVLGRYVDGVTDGEAAVIELPVGKGRLILIGAATVDADTDPVMEAVVRYALQNVELPYTVSAGSAAYLREMPDGKRYLLAANLDGKGGIVQPAACEPTALAPYETLVLAL